MHLCKYALLDMSLFGYDIHRILRGTAHKCHGWGRGFLRRLGTDDSLLLLSIKLIINSFHKKVLLFDITRNG